MKCTTPPVTPAQVRFWLTDLFDSYVGLSGSTSVRIEWTDAQGVTRTNFGAVDTSDESVNWQLDPEPSRTLTRSAIEVSFGLDVPGWVAMGQETYREMSDACDAQWDAMQAAQDADLVTVTESIADQQSAKWLAEHVAECLATGGSF